MSWWDILKVYTFAPTTDVNSPDFIPFDKRSTPEEVKRKIDNDPYFLIVWGTISGAKWAKDESGFSKYKEIMKIMDNSNVKPDWVKKTLINVDGDNYSPMYWNDSTGWNINELDGLLMHIHGQPSWFK
tara:strand:+ start:770 stop:1153 length:384 start_codon:yes stop_codon:yes gene_type:complete